MNGKGAFRGVLVVAKDSKIKSIKELKGKRFAFGDPNSTLSHYVPHYMLIKNGIFLKDLEKYAFTDKHDNVARGVLKGAFDAGGLKPAVANEYLRKGLRILAISDWIPEHLFAASKDLDAATRTKLMNALLNIDANILKSIKPEISGIEAVRDKDYDGLRNIITTVQSLDPPEL